MSRGPQTFRQRDLCAAIKAVVAAGGKVARVEVDKDGRIIVVLANGKEQLVDKAVANEWDAT
jgi:flagellar hook protein FlgE